MAETKLLRVFPPVDPDRMPYLVPFALAPGLAGFFSIISPVAKAHFGLIQRGLDALLRGAAEMVVVRPAADRQPEARRTGTPEILVVLIAAQLGVAVKIADFFKHAPVNHET